jgi:hypothetical protein
MALVDALPASARQWAAIRLVEQRSYFVQPLGSQYGNGASSGGEQAFLLEI